jgi:maltooligosyltrehalose trehalohydrolase
MHDSSPTHFLQELNETVDRYCESTGKKIHLIAESGFNVPKVLTPLQDGGFGFDAQWLDDYQHAIFALITGEHEGYYRDYRGIQDVMEILNEAYAYVGDEHTFKRKSPGESYRWIPADKFVVFSQNHDQVGNRLLGDRLTAISGLEAAKLAAGLVLLSPYVPLLFMGEEYGEEAPFLFFTDYQSQHLIDAIREGRRSEFANFHWQGEVPDPQSQATVEQSKLNWQQRYTKTGAKVMQYYRALIQLRKKRLFSPQADRQIKALFRQGEKLLFIQKSDGKAEAGVVANFSNETCIYAFPFEGGVYTKILDSTDGAWGGPGAILPNKAKAGDNHTVPPFTFAVYLKMQSKEATANV